MDLMNALTIISLAISLISGYCMGQLFSAFVSFRPYRWLRILCYASLAAISATVIFNQDMVNISYAYIALCLVLLIGYEGPLLHKFSASVILYTFVPTLNYILDYVLYYPAWVQQHTEAFRITPVDFAISVFRCCIIALLWYTIYRSFFHRMQSLREYATTRIWVLLDIISCGSLLLTGYIIVTTSDAMHLYSIPFTTVSLLTEIGILYLVGYMTESTHTAVENENLKLQQDYYQQLEHNQLEIRKLRHDMNNHLSTIGEYLNNNQIEEAKTYFTELSETVRGTSRIFCRNSLVNAVINSKYSQAEQLEIDTFFHIDLSERLPLKDVELCSLFANTLDNALEACQKIKEPSLRKIEMKARCINNFFSYQIANSFTGSIFQKDGRYLSSKDNPKNHGIGLMRVGDIVKKYHGSLEIKAEDGRFVVTCIIPY